MITAIILAAGLSSRMGFPKQLLALGNRSLLRIVTENVLASAVDEVMVVTGCREDEVSATIKDLPVNIIFNPHYEQGQGTSLALGVRTINIKTTAFLVFMCDQPLISPSLINMVIREFKERRSLALRPIYQGLPGHPVIFSSSLSLEMEALKGDEGARQVLKKLGNKVDYLLVQDEAVILDVDTPESYENLKQMMFT
ncbi:MAG: nucleotidyltransferase family protein [Desulfotomaculaceae bacterium]|nr:nucleotidyltransferase family protein [Desulfotomaculaceae bacterium]